MRCHRHRKMGEPGESRGEGNPGKSSGYPREKFHLYEELDELSVGVAGGSLCGVFWNYTLSLSGAFVGRRIVFRQIYIRLERHPTLIHGEKFRLDIIPFSLRLQEGEDRQAGSLFVA